MRKLLFALAIAMVTAAAVTAPSAQAQTYPDVSKRTAFSPDANYMSKAGYLRYRYFVQSGDFISYEQALQIVQGQGG